MSTAAAAKQLVRPAVGGGEEKWAGECAQLFRSVLRPLTRKVDSQGCRKTSNAVLILVDPSASNPGHFHDL